MLRALLPLLLTSCATGYLYAYKTPPNADSGETGTESDADADADGDGDTDADADGDTDADADADPGTPATCQEVLDGSPGSPDGEYTLYVGGDAAHPWTAHCARMDASPAEYLTVEGAANFSQYTASNGGSSVRTVYSRIRLDPSTLKVDISDQTFSASTGTLHTSDVDVTAMPYAVAASCDYTPSGEGSIDLGDAPFAVRDDHFVVGGYMASGEATYASDRKSVALAGGGYCGWIAPDPKLYNPVNDAGGFLLQLEYAP